MFSPQGEEKERFNAIAEELSQLSTKFSNNLLDGAPALDMLSVRTCTVRSRFLTVEEALTDCEMSVLTGTKAFKKMVSDKSEVEGLPMSALALAAQQAGAELKKVSHCATVCCFKERFKP